GTAGNDQGVAEGSMGVDASSYDRSGLAHLFVTNYEGQKHALYHNDYLAELPPEQQSFRYYSTRARLASLDRVLVGWGTGFVDVENRGWEDLFFVSGHALHYSARLQRGSRAQHAVLLRNLGDGTFREMSKRGGAYFASRHMARGLALGDLDNDGRV